MSLKRIFTLAVLVALTASGIAVAQGAPTGKVSGQVTSEGQALPGVTVTFESDKLQGTRLVVTDGNGNYTSPPLPPGEYQVSFALEGFQTQAVAKRVGANQSVVIDVEMPSGTVTEEIVVTGEATQTISEDSTVATTVTKQDLENLPIARNFNSAVALAPGVHTTGPNNNISISGAQSWENLFTLNGVVLNENIRGQAFDLFIEDAIQETTTASAGVSAEFGRFTGGVVTAITKSGGNSFEGSIRTSRTNDDWLGRNEFSPENREDKVNHTEEATFGGRILRDRLWFFAAGRDNESSNTATASIFGLGYNRGNSEERTEGKLTLALTPKHQLQATRIEIEEVQTNVPHGGLGGFLVLLDDGSLDDSRSLPQELEVFNYTGVITQNFFAEAQVSERQFTFQGTGGTDQSIDTGTPFWDIPRGVIYNESLFCDSDFISACRPEERDNEAARLKGSYFLSTGGAGSHDLSFGYETFTDIRASDNHQSPNDLMIWNFASSTIDRTNNTILPNIAPGATTIQHLPILNPTQGTDFQTDSYFLNDRWRLNDKWSFNLGVRYDETDAVNSLLLPVAADSVLSPRLGATWDVKGDGSWVLNFSAATYAGPLANGVFDDSSSAGNPARFGYVYLGDPIGPAFGNPVPTSQAVQMVFDWFESVCPGAIPDNTFSDPRPGAFACPFLIQLNIPGATTVLDQGLSTTTADELAVGFTHPLGNRGTIRVDLIDRTFGDFFLTQRDTTTGVGSDESGNQFDLGVIRNDDSILEREYRAIETAFNTRWLNNKLRFGGNLTLSEAEGNFDGETGGSGPVTSGLGEYPEYFDLAWAGPKGKLSIDQEVRARMWAMYDILNSDRHYLNVSLLQNFFSGSPYSALVTDLDTTPYVTNPGYITPLPEGITYYFSDRGAFTTDDITRTDIGLNYSFKVKRFEFFVQPEWINVFNEDGVTNVNTTVLTANDDPSLIPFNPFTTTPVEGVHFRFDDDFGRPQEEDDLQAVRQFRFSFGVRLNPR